MGNKFADKVLMHIFDMMRHIKTSALKVEFIKRYPGFTYSPDHCRTEYEFLKNYCTDDTAAKLDNIDGISDKLVSSLYDDYMSMSAENVQDLSPEAECAEKVFISFVKMFNVSAKYMNELECWPSERIAQSVLEYMRDYYSGHWKYGISTVEYYLECLLTSVGMENSHLNIYQEMDLEQKTQ
ncbi:MAG: hypothetical protein OSJ73_12870 [Lachnospiraceae bacterium]|jgi:hypothetical protein|nr:hypothetical protein [Lachnospiraceae bacterium]